MAQACTLGSAPKQLATPEKILVLVAQLQMNLQPHHNLPSHTALPFTPSAALAFTKGKGDGAALMVICPQLKTVALLVRGSLRQMLDQ